MKGSRELVVGIRLHFVVAITYGKDVIPAEEYEEMNAEFFALFIRWNFLGSFEIAGKTPNDSKTFVIENDASQTSAKVRAVMEQSGVTLQTIPPRSPDLNPIENKFHEVRKRMKLAGKPNNVQHQTWDEFVSFVKFTFSATS